MAKRRKKKDNQNYLSVPGFELDDQAKRSIGLVLIFAFGFISLLGLFNLSGQMGVFISKWLSLIFGFGKWLVPLIFLFWGILIVKERTIEVKKSDYVGISLLFLSYQTLFHFFIRQADWLAAVRDGVGGGYIGYYLSQGTIYILGFWGGVIALLSIFLVSLVLVFNTSLSKIIGRESIFGKIAAIGSEFFRTLFSSAVKESTGEDVRAMATEEPGEDAIETWTAKAIADLEESKKEDTLSEVRRKADKPAKQEKISWPKNSIKIDLPIELLQAHTGEAVGGDTDLNTAKIKKTLENFGIDVDMGETKVGPTVTQYTFKPAEGVKVSRITTLNNDLSLALAAHPIRIEAPIPGKSLVGVEVPNKTKAIVGLRDVLEDPVFKTRKNNLMIALGKDVAGAAWMYDITRMPHLLVAGATNSGKSVCLNTIIVSLLYQNNPDNLRFIMVDPKRVELPAYNGIPHLLTPVITEVSKTINALKWCLNEMDRRYDLLNKSGKKNIQAYNADSGEKIPFIIFIIDELADFMMTAGKEMEAAIIRLAQMSRAVGIHLILATQRPSVDVITGLIKANIPARIAFAVASLVDSKTILDSSGAEKLLGQGDMLLSTAELAKPKRIQGAYVSDDEIKDVINYIKEKSGTADYLEGVTDRQRVGGVAGVGLDGVHGDEDELFEEAKDIIVKAGKASTSMLQRRLSIGYGRAAKILDMLEDAGVISPANGSKPRDVIISREQYEAAGPSSMPMHKREEAMVPDSYLDEDPGEGLVLESTPFEEEIVEAVEETEEDEQDIVQDEDEILEEIKREDEDAREPEKKVEPGKPRVFSDEDEDEMFFSR